MPLSKLLTYSQIIIFSLFAFYLVYYQIQRLFLNRIEDDFLKMDYKSVVTRLSNILRWPLPKSLKAWALHYRACSYDGIGFYIQALADINTAISMSSNDLNLRIEKASILINQKDFIQAKQVLNDIISIQPDNSRALCSRSICFQELGDPNKALADALEAIGLDNNSPKNYWQLANVYRELNNFKDAYKVLSKGLSEFPQDSILLRNRAEVYFEMEDYENAFNDFSKAISIKPDFESNYICRGIAYAKRQLYVKALEDFEKVRDINPNSDSGFWHIAWCYSQMGKKLEAIDYYTKAIVLNSDNPKTLHNRSILFREIGKNSESISDLDLAISIDPTDVENYVIKSSTLLLIEGKEGEALNTVEKALQLSPSYSSAMELREKILIAINQKEKHN